VALDLNIALEEAEAAYHALMTGQSVAEIRDQNGELVRYSPANAAKLLAYITTLKSKLGLTSPCTIGPAGAWF